MAAPVNPNVMFLRSLLAVCLLFHHGTLLAMSCPRSSVEREVANSDLVFYGEVVDIEIVGNVPEHCDAPDIACAAPKQVSFLVERTWKGQTGSQVSVFVPFSTYGRWSPFFELGESYVVYSRNLDGKLRVGPCTRGAPARSMQNAPVAVEIECLDRLSGKSADHSSEQMGGEKPESLRWFQCRNSEPVTPPKVSSPCNN